MTTVKIERNAKGRCIGYNILGHVTEPILCSAISAITQTAVISLSEVLNHKIRINSADGFLKVTFVQFPTKNSELVIDCMLAGLRTIEKQYQGVLYIVDKRKSEEDAE